MSFWSITEQSPNRIVTKEDLSSKTSPFSSCSYFALICIPGLLAIWTGLPLLPGKIVCQPSGKNLAECRKIQSFLNIPVKTEIIQQQQKLSRIVESPIPGETTLVWVGVGYIGGVILLILLFSSQVTIKKIYTFDRNSASVKLQKFTTLTSAQTIYNQKEINGISFQITDFLIGSDSPNFIVALNLEFGQQPVKFTPDSHKHPIVYMDECKSFADVISSIIYPICEILNLSWRLNIFSKFGSFSFNFADKQLEQYIKGKNVNISFASIQGLDINTLSNGRYVVPTDDSAIDSYIHYEYIYQIYLITKDGQNIPLINIESREAAGKDPRRESFPTNDNRAYKLAKQIQVQLNQLIHQ